MAGRPSKYTKAVQKAADAYVDGGHVGCGDVVPSLAGMSCELGVTRQTLRNWADEHGQFLATLDRCKERQERLALSGGLSNEFNSAIVKLLLANHGYSDKQHLEHTGPNGGPVQVQTIDPTKLSSGALKELLAARASAETDG